MTRDMAVEEATGRTVAVRTCVYCVMDTSDPDIEFDVGGRCNHCRACAGRLAEVEGLRASGAIEQAVAEITRNGQGRRYDCIVGLSGGVDSSYLAYEAVALGLRPLAIHLDNGWDSEPATHNIHHLVRSLGLDLHTHVVDWPEFRDIQVAFFKADVIDIEMITDHAINALACDLALKHGVRHILTGVNTATESILPSAWVHSKTDRRNLRSIHRAHGTRPLKTLPTASTLRVRYLRAFRGIRMLNLLDLVHYNKRAAIETLRDSLGWTTYGGKHNESTFTRFYQQYILPKKFGVDKRRAHLSSLICSNQVTRDQALGELDQPTYDPAIIEADIAYVAKKLGMSRSEFDEYIARPPRSHYEYHSDQSYLRALSTMKRKLGLRATTA
jgi:N-acetyl sugar amidotransferase